MCRVHAPAMSPFFHAHAVHEFSQWAERNGILVSVKPGGVVGAFNVNVRHLTHRLVRTCDVQCHDFHSTVGAPSDSALFIVKDTWAPDGLCATLLCVTTAPNHSKLGLASRNPCKIAAGLALVSKDLSRQSTLRGACGCPRVMSTTRDLSSLVLDSSGPQSSHAVVHVEEQLGAPTETHDRDARQSNLLSDRRHCLPVRSIAERGSARDSSVSAYLPATCGIVSRTRGFRFSRDQPKSC